MDPLTIATLASTALKAGPALIRVVGNLFGSNATADKVANAVERIETEYSTATSQQKGLESQLKQLSSTELVQLQTMQTELARIEAEREARQLESTEILFSEGQHTIREGDKAQHSTVIKCRPNLAYISMFATAIYVLGMSLAHAFDYGSGADMAVAAFLISPAGAYMGLRHREKEKGLAS
ncbi:hypothetical protein [Thaumasiovibrio subtropicus]|uniref:hypothetical protein n=1 Tax=Thaumasiovibrio subtropicus TaxID=1891207 RepID=UPI00131D3DB9|nr:hypothetical protein [Thaumasiovibrio subtropicus]